MKKAQLKQLRLLIKGLPEIPLLHEGKADTIPVKTLVSGAKMIQEGVQNDKDGKPIVPELFYTTEQEVPKTVNKEKFFIEHMAKGFTAQQTVDYWNDRYKRVQEAIANYVAPPKKQETVEEIKQRVADEEDKRIAKEEREYQKAVSKRRLAFPRGKKKR